MFILKFLFSGVTLRICIVHFRPHRRNEDNNVTITEIRTHTNFSTFKYIFLLSFLGYLTQLFTVLTMHFLPQTDTHTHPNTDFDCPFSFSLSHSFDLSLEITAERADAFLFTVRFSLKRARTSCCCCFIFFDLFKFVGHKSLFQIGGKCSSSIV